MNILLINNYFPPEIGAASHLYYYLGKELVKLGHDVFVLTGIPRYNIPKEVYEEYKLKNKTIEEIDGMTVIRTILPYIERDKTLRRGIEHFEIAWRMKKKGGKLLKSIDIALVYSPPLTLFLTAKFLSEKLNFPFILNIQDLFPQSVIDLGLMRNKYVISFFNFIEKKAYEYADLITVHSESNANYILKVLGNDKNNKVVIFENWIDTKEITPGPKDNNFSRKYNLLDKFIVSFAGTLGFSQDLDVILQAAKITEKEENILYLIVGDGVQFESVKNNIDKLSLKNVILLPSVPKEIYPMILWSSDISLVTLKKDVKTPVVPSKILSIMSAGIPVIATLNLEGDAPKLIERAKAGFTIPAGDSTALANTILKLYKNEVLRKELGINGRKYVVENLSAESAAKNYEKLFEKVILDYKKRRNI